jgi:hypothetical protein
LQHITRETTCEVSQGLRIKPGQNATKSMIAIVQERKRNFEMMKKNYEKKVRQQGKM